jgi:hypothetical protein
MMGPENLSFADAPADQIGRRLVFFGAGPLPASASENAPGVANRLWNFLQPALAAGHDCLVFSLESGAPSIEEGGGQIEIQEWRDRTWQKVRVMAEDCLVPERLGPLILCRQSIAPFQFGLSWDQQCVGRPARWGRHIGRARRWRRVDYRARGMPTPVHRMSRYDRRSR